MSAYEDIGYVERPSLKARKELRLATVRDREIDKMKRLLEGNSNDLQKNRPDPGNLKQYR